MDAKRIVEHVQRQLDMSGDTSVYLDCYDASQAALYRAALEPAGYRVTVRQNRPMWLEIHATNKEG